MFLPYLLNEESVSVSILVSLFSSSNFFEVLCQQDWSSYQGLFCFLKRTHAVSKPFCHDSVPTILPSPYSTAEVGISQWKNFHGHLMNVLIYQLLIDQVVTDHVLTDLG